MINRTFPDSFILPHSSLQGGLLPMLAGNSGQKAEAVGQQRHMGFFAQ